MDDEYHYYDLPSGVMPWQAPPGFESPVPPARGDSLPAGHSRSWLVGLRGGGGEHEGRVGVRWLLIAIAIVLIGNFVVLPFVENALDEGNGILDEIEKVIDESQQTSDSGTSSYASLVIRGISFDPDA